MEGTSRSRFKKANQPHFGDYTTKRLKVFLTFFLSGLSAPNSSWGKDQGRRNCHVWRRTRKHTRLCCIVGIAVARWDPQLLAVTKACQRLDFS